MCLLVFSLSAHPDYKFIIAANRDEFYARPTLAASFWEENTSVLAGKDLAKGGTWMGIEKSGRFAALTNFRNPALNKPHMPSRGHLVYNYLKDSCDAKTYLENVLNDGNTYNGYNLLAGTPDELYYLSNRSESGILKVENGVHGLSNNLLDVPWPKVKKAKERFLECLSHREIAHEKLFELLKDTEHPPDSELPQTGVTLERERLLSPAFIVSPDYGTCSSTVLLVDRRNHVRFWERSFKPDTPIPTGEVYYEFDIE